MWCEHKMRLRVNGCEDKWTTPDTPAVVTGVY